MVNFRTYHENPRVQAIADAVQNVVAVMGACAQSFLYLWQSCGYLDHQTSGKILNREVSSSRFSQEYLLSPQSQEGPIYLRLSYFWEIDVCFYQTTGSWMSPIDKISWFIHTLQSPSIWLLYRQIEHTFSSKLLMNSRSWRLNFQVSGSKMWLDLLWLRYT
jgi:hypothetical protein